MTKSSSKKRKLTEEYRNHTFCEWFRCKPDKKVIKKTDTNAVDAFDNKRYPTLDKCRVRT